MKSEVTFIELDETVSTNTFLANYQATDPDTITVATAEYQTAGRGQTGNSWESERGKNLLFSILVQPSSLPATHVFLLSETIALSIRDTIASIINHQSSITVKWPNDIYVGDYKIAGILIENTLCGPNIGRSIIGCGVNINQTEFLFPSLIPHPSSPPQAPTPVSLRQLIGHDIERRPILEKIIDTFHRRYESLIPHPSTLTPQPSSLIRAASVSLHADYLAALYRRTGFHPFRDAHGLFDAEIIDVEPSGHLLLRDTSGTIRRYAFKEVEYVKNKNFV